MPVILTADLIATAPNTPGYLNLTDFETVIVATGVTVSSADNTALVGQGNGQTFIVLGTAAGFYGFGNVEDLPLTLTIGATGTIIGSASGILCGGAYTVIQNAGTIIGSIAIELYGPTVITNTGTITAQSGVAILMQRDHADVVVNAGLIAGSVVLKGGADSWDGRGGRVLGTIDLGAGTDTAIGGDWNDTIVGGTSPDEIDLGAGDDVFRASPASGDDGDDVVDGGAGRDLYDASGATLGLVVALGPGTAHGVEIGTDLLSGFERVRTGSGDDTLSGSGKADVLHAGDGTNVLSGGGGDDRLVSFSLSTNTMSGGSGNDRLTSGDFGDSLSGGDGDDVIYGRFDADRMSGGAGADRFLFRDVEELLAFTSALPEDRITDFTLGEDLIDLRRMDADFPLAGNQDFTFVGSGPITSTGQVAVEVRGGSTYVQLAVYTAGVTAELRLDGILALTAADFVL
jgi:Ca2+-binding RTX toxin-like protein